MAWWLYIWALGPNLPRVQDLVLPFLAESLQACNSSLSLFPLYEKWESSLR